MNNKQTFKKYYNRLALEGFLKSFLIGVAIAFAIYCAVVLIMWFTESEWLLWLAVGLFAGALICTTPALYFGRYKPTTKAIAARVDSLGLEERIITMSELRHDDSFIAMRQREDAMAALGRVNAKSVKISVSIASIIVACIMFLFGTSMTVVTALANEDIIDNPIDIIKDEIKPDVYYTMSYKVVGYTADGTYVPDMGGLIEGGEEQLITDGGTLEEVMAIADEGWAFYCWDDGLEEPVRQDTFVFEDILNGPQFNWGANQPAQSEEETSENSDSVIGYAESVWDSLGYEDSGYEDDMDEIFKDKYGDLLEGDPLFASGSGGADFLSGGDTLGKQPINGEGFVNTITVNEDGDITVTYYAVFVELSPSDDGEGGSGEGDPDAPKDQPQQQESEGNEGDEGEQDKENQSDGESGDGAGGRYEDKNQFIDDEQYYRDRFEEYYQQAMEIIASGGEVPDEIKAFIEAYYGIIE